MTPLLLSLLLVLGSPLAPRNELPIHAEKLTAFAAQDAPEGQDESDEPARPESEPEDPPITLASPEAQAAFEGGLENFGRGDFTEAAKQFRTAKKGAKKDAKNRVVAYEKACKESKKLPKIEKSIDQKQWRKALGELDRIETALGKKTPLEPHLKPLRTQIHEALYYPLANFEGKAPGPENLVKARRPPSATANTDLRFVHDGKVSLKWNAGKGSIGALGGLGVFGSVPLAAFEGTLVKEYRIFEMWIYSTDDEFGKFSLYFGIEEGGPGQVFEATSLLKTRCFFHHITVNKAGWQRVRIDLMKDIPKHHNLEWADVTGVALMVIPPSKGKLIYVDSLRLERP